MTVTAAQLRAFASAASQKIIDGIVANQKLLADAEITTPLRIRHFFAQIANETGGLAKLEENLNYSAKRLTQVWPGRFKTLAAAQPYANNPERLANKVYGGRLGNNKPGDGWDYRGSGLMQTTGKANFAEVEKETGVKCLSQPALLRTFPGALQAACIYWKNNGINKLADKDDIKAVSKAVNGGLIGLADRKTWLTKAGKVWPDRPASARPAPAADIPTIEPKPAPAPAPVSDKELIQRVQLGLTALNYNPGGADGLIGPLTAGAIRVFRADNKLPEGDFIDDELINTLANAKPREMIPARANATPAQVTAAVPEAKHNWLSKITAGGLGGTAGAGVLVDGVLKNVTDAKSYVNEFTDYLANVPGWAWCLAILGVAAFIYWKSQQSENASVAAFQSGDRR